jgi:hypothetical protein
MGPSALSKASPVLLEALSSATAAAAASRPQPFSSSAAAAAAASLPSPLSSGWSLRHAARLHAGRVAEGVQVGKHIHSTSCRSCRQPSPPYVPPSLKKEALLRPRSTPRLLFITYPPR